MQIHIELCKSDKSAAPIAGEYTPELSRLCAKNGLCAMHDFYICITLVHVQKILPPFQILFRKQVS